MAGDLLNRAPKRKANAKGLGRSAASTLICGISSPVRCLMGMQVGEVMGEVLMKMAAAMPLRGSRHR